MKKIVILISFVLLLTSCSISGESNMLNKIFNTDDYKADKKLESILESLENCNKDNVKLMFSKKAIGEDANFDEHLDYLFEFFQGNVLSWERKGGPFVSEHVSYGNHIKKESSVWYRVETDEQSYLFIFIEYLIDKEEPENVGLYTLRVILEENKDIEFASWDDVIIPGIYKPE